MAKLSVDQTLSRAKSHAKKGEFDEAQKLYHSVLQAFPKNGRAQKGLDAAISTVCMMIFAAVLDHNQFKLLRR